MFYFCSVKMLYTAKKLLTNATNLAISLTDFRKGLNKMITAEERDTKRKLKNNKKLYISLLILSIVLGLPWIAFLALLPAIRIIKITIDTKENIC